jgi:hypothetical protein
MKRLIAVMLVGLFMVCPSLVFAAGTVTASTPVKITVLGQTQRIIVTLTATADASNGSFPTFAFVPKTYGVEGWYLYSVETNPGTTGPTDNYDITIVDADEVDVAGSLLLNRDTSTSEIVYLGSVGYPIASGTWTWTMTNNSVNSAVVVAKLVFVAN